MGLFRVFSYIYSEEIAIIILIQTEKKLRSQLFYSKIAIEYFVHVNL
jgi:hypothetical protein